MKNSWLQDAVAGKEKEIVKKKQEAIKEKIKRERKAECDPEKDRKAKEASDRFPSRVVITEHEDWKELVIKPYPLSRLFLKIQTTRVVLFTAGLIGSLFIFWIVVFGLVFKFLDSLDLGKDIVLVVKIFWFPVFLCFLYSMIQLGRAFFIRRDDHILTLRFSGKGDYAFYKRNPKKPYSAGRNENLSIRLYLNDSELPARFDGNKSPYWGYIEIGAPDSEYYYWRTGIPAKDIRKIRDFLKNRRIKIKSKNKDMGD